MNKILTTIGISIAMFLVFFTSPTKTLAATLYFSAPASVSVDEVFSIDVFINSADRGFNIAESTIVFPKDLIEVTSVDTEPSATIFNFWFKLPSFSNVQGTISFSGGTTNGIVGPATQILTIRARAKGIGDALITASDASINASDGSGANILEDIEAKYITINKAVVTIPAKPLTPPQPKVEPVTPPATPAAPKEKPVVIRCSGIFTNCDIHFPSIEKVSIIPRTQTGFGIWVSGGAIEGTHVHLILRREGVFYKEIEAIVKDKKWEGLFTEIFSYGSYSIDATAETQDNHQSQPVTWSGINLFPPFTFYGFGLVFPWYIILDILLGLFVLAYLVVFIRYYFASGKRMQFGLWSWLLLIAVISTSATTHFLWKEEHSLAVTFWENTDIPCINLEHSYFEKFEPVDLQIFINKKPQVIPADTGVSPQCVAQIHSHDTTGRLHFTRTGKDITLPDFFTLAGITLKQNNYKLQVTVNGKDYTELIDSYPLNPGDIIVINYTTLR